MKKIFLFILMCFVITQYADAQSKRIYISKHGGTKKLLTFGKIGYNFYHFNNASDNCDTLICSGAGYEMCKIDKGIIKLSKEDGKYYALYNKAIRAAEKHSRKSKKVSGQFNLVLENKTLSIKYTNADQKGNTDIEIEVM